MTIAFKSRINKTRRQMFSRLCEAADYVSPRESTAALDEFVALALPCIRRGSELHNILSALRGKRQTYYVGSKLLPALLKDRPDIFTPVVLRQLWRMLDRDNSAFHTKMHDAVMEVEDRITCASGPGA